MRSGASTLPTCPWPRAFCIWPPCSTGTRATCSTGSSPTHSTSAFACKPSIRPCAAPRPPTSSIPTKEPSLPASLTSRPCSPPAAASAAMVGAAPPITPSSSASDIRSNGSTSTSTRPTTASTYFTNSTRTLLTTTTADPTKASAAKHPPMPTKITLHSIIIILLNKPR